MIGWTAVAAAAPPQVIHQLEITPALRVDPEYPAGESSSARCSVRVWLDETGVPVSTEARGCPPAFARAAERGLLQWRWNPSQPVRADVTVSVAFVMEDGPVVPVPDGCRWSVAVGPDGRVTAEDPPDPCAAWLIEQLPARLVPATPQTCEVWRNRGGRWSDWCSPAMEALLEPLLRDSRWGPEGRTDLVVTTGAR